MKLLFVLISLSAGFAQAPSSFPSTATVSEKAWKSATELPNVDMTGLSPDKKQAVLKLLREEDCTCGCKMKMAQCRMVDPKCAFSRMSANSAVKAIKDGKTPDEMRTAALAENHLKTLDDYVKIRTEGEPTKGPPSAKITLVEFSDFQCPFCAKAAFQIDEIMRQHPGEIRLVYKQYPIQLVHKEAVLAAEASLAANNQSKFWLMHDRMFSNANKLSRENIIAWAKEFNLDMPKFLKDLDSKETATLVARDIDEADYIGVLGTPTVFLNGRRYNGELTVADFGKVVEGELKK
jgi:protein-disulfide isomerase